MPTTEETNTAAAESQRQPKRRDAAPPLLSATEQIDERGEICIEIVIPGRTGSWLVCDPMRGMGIDPPTLRGRWRQREMASGLSAAAETNLAQLPDVPGQCVAIHLSRLYVRIFDPLADPRNRALIASFNQVWVSSPYSQGMAYQPVPERVFNLRGRTPEGTADNAATWLYWMQRQLGMWHAKQVTAVLCRNSASPEAKFPEVRLPGGETYVGDPTVNFDASALPGEPRTLTQSIRANEFARKQGVLKTVVE